MIAAGGTLFAGAHMDPMLRAWMDVLIEYAEDWDRAFRSKQTNYFTQEYWYLFTACTKAYLDGRPLAIAQAAAKMRTDLSENAKTDRINKAVDDGFLLKLDSERDARQKHLVPSEKLITLLTGHLGRTLEGARRAICVPPDR